MALTDAVQNSTQLPVSITWTRDDGSALNLSGATITGRIISIETGVARDIDGSLDITTAASGVFQWDYGTTDVGTAGVFYVQFVATYGTGEKVRSKKQLWNVKQAI